MQSTKTRHLRRVRDRDLPDPYRLWIDRSVPLPSGVTVLPRTIRLASEICRLVYVGGMFMAGGGIFLFLFLRFKEDGWGAEAVAVVIFATAFGFGLPLWMAYRLWRTVGAWRDQQAGVLRTGILVGPEGMLVRVLPNWCYPIPRDRFVRAKEWSSGGDSVGVDFLRIETRDGFVDLDADDLTVDAKGVNATVATARRGAAVS
jgi:hypothetical protein